MMKKFFEKLSHGLLVSSCLAVLAVTHRYLRDGNDDEELMDVGRFLYESDDKNCLEYSWCRFTLGLVLLLTTPLLIFWNEHQFVKLETLYKYAKKKVRDLPSPKFPLSESMNGQFVCFSGRLSGETTIRDNLFPTITVDNALLLVREIEINQYVQKEKGENNYVLEEKWCPCPQKDPSRFPDKKNSNGNWELFSDKAKMIDTGNTLNGNPIKFGDNIVVFRAPNPNIGAFAIPPELLNEAFLGDRHVHRLGELQLIKESQGTWINFDWSSYQKTCVIPLDPELTQTELISSAFKEGDFVYDGTPERNGTIRFQWRFVKPQDMTVVAEAVSPGTPCVAGYGSNGHQNVRERGRMSKMILQDLKYGFQDEECPLIGKHTQVNTEHWSVTPFSVTSRSWFPPYHEDFHGRLWLFAPGLYSAHEMFRRAHLASAKCLWKVRGISYIALFAGWCLVFEPLTNIFYVSFLRSLLSLTFATFAFVLATTCCLTCTAIARLTARPVQSLLIIATVWVVIVELSNKFGIDEKQEQEESTMYAWPN